MKEFFEKKDPALVRVFNDKLRELADEKNDITNFISERYRFMYNKAPENQKWYHEWMLGLEKKHLEWVTKQIRKFEFFKRKAQGKPVNNNWEGKLAEAKLVPITNFVDRPGTSRGRIQIKCPFHNDRTPSCTIYVDQNKWWCHACAEGGDVIDFIQKKLEIGFKEAVTYLTN